MSNNGEIIKTVITKGYAENQNLPHSIISSIGYVSKYNQCKQKQIRRYIEEKHVKLEEVLREEVIDIAKWDDANQTFCWNMTDKRIPYFFSIEHPYSLHETGQIKKYQKQYAWVSLEYLP